MELMLIGGDIQGIGTTPIDRKQIHIGLYVSDLTIDIPITDTIY
jgi:hypothetical protein